MASKKPRKEEFQPEDEFDPEEITDEAEDLEETDDLDQEVEDDIPDEDLEEEPPLNGSKSSLSGLVDTPGRWKRIAAAGPDPPD